MAQPPTAGEIAQLLAEWSAGRPESAEELWSAVYRELRQIASAYTRNERPDHTLETAAPVNEADLTICQRQTFRQGNRKHFFCATFVLSGARPEQLTALEEALQQLETLNPRQARVVDMRFFVGLTAEQTAAVLNVSPETIKLDWRFAEVRLQRQMRSGRESS